MAFAASDTRRAGALSGLILVAGLTACSRPPLRVARNLSEFHGVVVSNSPMLAERVLPSLEGERLVVVYSLLFENAGSDDVTVGLGYATARVGTRFALVDCRVLGRPVPVLDLTPGQRWRVDCRISLTPEATGTVALGDTDLLLAIPLRSPIGRAELRLSYLLRVEDAT